MHAHRAFMALMLVSICAAAPGRSLADPSTSTPAVLDDPQATYTAAWAGIWDVYEETRDCAGGPILHTSVYRDTVCAGEAYILLSGYGRGLTCFGPGFTDIGFNLQCSGGSTCGCVGTCNVTLTKVVNWTLNGDVATTVLTESYAYSSLFPSCSPPNECYRTTGTRTRISPGCFLTPTLRQTWGRLKLLYR
jgi:hypothetical protein